ncbi:MAG: hypothetical protein EHM58_15330 [Ignavibacteriae bacterium]|nr:MAG: hypothetical protein EHM58_15330 [Ignavibacteriota bacterium]
MKTKIGLIFLIFSSFLSLFSQIRLEGHFVPDNNNPIFGEYHEEFYFKIDGGFYYKEHTDYKGTLLGIGKYQIYGGKLTLTFDSLPQFAYDSITSSVSILKEWTSKSDTTMYKCYIEDKADEAPLWGAIIKLCKNVDGKDIPYDSSFEADEKGLVKLKINKKQMPLTIHVYYTGYQHFVYYINDDKCRKVVFRMGTFSSWYNTIKADSIKEYNIKDIDNNSFILSKFHGYDDWQFNKED